MAILIIKTSFDEIASKLGSCHDFWVWSNFGAPNPKISLMMITVAIASS